MKPEKEWELAIALEKYINPDDPEFDLVFALKIMGERPDWFTGEEIRKVSEYAGRHGPDCGSSMDDDENEDADHPEEPSDLEEK